MREKTIDEIVKYITSLEDHQLLYLLSFIDEMFGSR